MKKQFLTTIVLTAVLGFAASNVFADTYSFDDNWVDWPGFPSNLPATDENGTPVIGSMDVTVTGGLLTKVEIFLKSSTRQSYDSLFINTSYNGGNTNGGVWSTTTSNSVPTYNPVGGTNWQDWDYFIRDGNDAHPFVADESQAADGFYYVNDVYDYTHTASTGGIRQNSPNGIDSPDLLPTGTDVSGILSGTTITYDFSSFLGGGLEVVGGFFVAYAPWCDNDIIGGGSPVPEPATMLLFGTGLIGLAGISRRRCNK